MKHFFYALSLLFLFACTHARMVKLEYGEGGEIAVHPRDSLEARQKAETLMRQTCGSKPFKIVSEGEAVVGSVTHNNSQGNIDPKKNGGASVNQYGSSYTSNTTEWRIQFKCVK